MCLLAVAVTLLSLLLYFSLHCPTFSQAGHCYTDVKVCGSLRQRLYFEEGQQPHCDCEQGFGRQAGSAGGQGRCWQGFSRGFCNRGELLNITSSGVECQPNPCPASKRPHM